MKQSSQYWVVIPATGTGQRMKASCPKQYIQLAAKTILQHTLDNLLSHPLINGAVLVINREDKHWDKVNYRHFKPVLVCTGGDQRHHSVFNGLDFLKRHTKQNPYVLIHDAVRPFVSHTDLDRLIEALKHCEDGALLAVPVTDTLKLANNNGFVKTTHPRDHLWRAFTPQAFKLDKIYTALENVIRRKLDVTDDASAMEMMGAQPRLVQGDGDNIKITTPHDLVIAEKILYVNK